MNDLLFTEDRFTFSFVAPGDGPVIECALDRLDEGGFEGECFDDEGTVVPMKIGAFEE